MGLSIEEGHVILSGRDTARSPEESGRRVVSFGRLAMSAPRLSEGMELFGEYEGSGFKEPVYLARRADGQVLQLSRLVYLVAAEADGYKDFEQIALQVSERFGRTVSADNVRFLVEEKLRPLGMLAAADGSGPGKLARAKPVLALHWRTPILPKGPVRALTAVFYPLFFTPVLVAVLAGLAVLDYWLFFVHGITQSALEVLYQPGLFLMVFGLTLLSALIHEVGHATACRYGGANPGRIGVGIYFVWLVFYNDVTDTYRLGRAGRLLTDLGGVYFNAVFALVIAGAYFLTGYKPLLLVVFVEQVAMLYQFMPFVRLDGYYVVSDLTGVPDLFARIKPILRSMIPGRATDGRVEELKPWVRVAVGAWVLTAIPALLCLFAWLIVKAPLMYSTAWESFLVHYDGLRDAFGNGNAVDVVADLLQIVLLVVPVAGITLIFATFGVRSSAAAWRWSAGKRILRAASVTIALAIGAILPFVWLTTPYGDDGIVQRTGHATFQGVAAPEVPATELDVPTPEGAVEGRTPPSEQLRYSISPKPTGHAPGRVPASASATPTASASAAPASSSASAAPASAAPASATPTASASAAPASSSASAAPASAAPASAAPASATPTASASAAPASSSASAAPASAAPASAAPASATPTASASAAPASSSASAAPASASAARPLPLPRSP